MRIRFPRPDFGDWNDVELTYGVYMAEGDGSGGGGTGATGATGAAGTAAAAAAAATTTAATTAAMTAAATPADWHAELPEDLRDAAKTFKHPADAVKSARDLRGKLSNALFPLDATADDTAKAEHSKRLSTFLGVPDAPEKYVFKNPETLPDGTDAEAVKTVQAAFAKKMHAAGVPPAMAQEAINFIWEFNDQKQGELATTRIEANKAAEAAVRKAWGGKYDENLALSQRAINDYGGADLVNFLKTTGLGNNLAIANAFRDLGVYRSEDGMVGGATTAEANNFLAQANEKMADPAYWNSQDPKHARLRQEVESLYARAHPGGPEIGPGVGSVG